MHYPIIPQLYEASKSSSYNIQQDCSLMMKFVRNYAMIIDIAGNYKRGYGMRNIARIMKFLSLPMALTTAAYILFLNVVEYPQSLTLVFQYISYILFITGMLLGLRFNKSKVFFLCLILGISQLLLSNDYLIFPFINDKLPDIFNILALLLPINLLLFSLFKERGIFTPWGKLKHGFIIAQFIFAWWLLIPQNQSLRLFTYFRLLHFTLLDTLAIPQLSSLLFLFAFLVLCTKLYFNPTIIDSSFAGVVIMTFIGLLLKDHFLGLNLFYAMAGLILVIGVVEASYFMAYKDELTGIPARRALKESMLKLSGKYTIAMIDIDFFKKFNDAYGHDIGDEVLHRVASNLARVTGGGKAYRFGGEEFTLLFPNKTKEEVIPQLEELRKNIAKQKHAYKRKRKVNGKEKVVTKQLNVTISIGVAEKNENYKTAEEVLQAADKALYRAKKKGRNCLCK
jgi:diguanylate cyclase (GGDEF)-like protein